jgi:hypothetical protein
MRRSGDTVALKIAHPKPADWAPPTKQGTGNGNRNP